MESGFGVNGIRRRRQQSSDYPTAHCPTDKLHGDSITSKSNIVIDRRCIDLCLYTEPALYRDSSFARPLCPLRSPSDSPRYLPVYPPRIIERSAPSTHRAQDFVLRGQERDFGLYEIRKWSRKQVGNVTFDLKSSGRLMCVCAHFNRLLAAAALAHIS
ncbi:hypothetical protein Bbelb_135220 [Branchiostoma belcheri]|nr:hypothetical protein Bbelb_135220 [Branchiostoma belcheri]